MQAHPRPRPPRRRRRASRTGRLRPRHLSPDRSRSSWSESWRPAPPLIHIVDLQGRPRRGIATRRRRAMRARRRRHSPPGLGRHSHRRRCARRARRGRRRVIVGTALWEDDDALAASSKRSASNWSSRSTCGRADRRCAAGPLTRAIDVDDALARCQRAGVTRLHVTADRSGRHDARTGSRPLPNRRARAASRSWRPAACATTAT